MVVRLSFSAFSTVVLFFLLQLQLHFGYVLSGGGDMTNCSASASCGGSVLVQFPFTFMYSNPTCGLTYMKCEGEHTQIQLYNHPFIVRNISYSEQRMEIDYLDSYKNDFCASPYNFTTLPPRMANHGLQLPDVNVTILKCPISMDRHGLPIGEDCGDGTVLYYVDDFSFLERVGHNHSCYVYQIPIKRGVPKNSNVSTALSQGTIMQKHGGVIIGSTVAAATVLLLFFGACFIARRRYQAKQTRSVTESSYTESSFNTTSKSSSKFDLESNSFRQRFRSVTIFTYKELEEATKNFDPANEVGDGGFGAVYFGKLKDGRKVAVKRLYENNFKRVAQFMNEIEILSNIRHPNLVCLYGCTSRHSRELLLVYEYVPNGTISDHIHGSRAATKPLSWKIRLSIAHQTAEALAYLHKLDPPIVHRDVKSTNILLENDYHVKVADFGLSRLFPMDVTHVSTAPAGTPGYVDPDYHKCYQLTDKSDVYSFGVVLCELISSLPAVDIRRHRHEINLANLAINKINEHALHEFVDKSLGYETDEWVKVTVRAVAELTFRCLATEKEIRPTMAETAECLKEILTGGHRDKSLVGPSPTEEDGALLKRSSSPLSPNSVTDKWLSMATTPNNSG